MKHNVIIPVIVKDLAVQLVDLINENTIVPDKIILINNTLDPYFKIDSKVPILQINNDKVVGTNEAWKQGFEVLDKDVKYITIFNEDIKIGKYFFKKSLEGMKVLKKCVAVFPTYNPDINFIDKEEPVKATTRHRKTNGDSITISKVFLDRLPPIPEDLKIFFGDNWIKLWAREWKLGYYIMVNTFVYHYGGAAIKEINKVKQFREKRRLERRVYNKIENELRKTGCYYDSRNAKTYRI